MNSFLVHDRILLRPFALGDVQAWTSWFNDQGITYYMNKGHFPITEREQEGRLNLKSADSIQLAIVEAETKALVGTIGLHQINWIHGTADISVLIGEKEAQGKGYGKIAISMVVEHAFKKLNLRKLTSGMWGNNKSSEACFKANGFILEGKRIAQYYCHGEYVDQLNYALFRTMWESKKS